MYAGTLCQLEFPLDEPLEDWFNGDTLPGLSVGATQYQLDNDRPIQRGMAGGSTSATRTHVSVGVDGDGNPNAIHTETEDTHERVATSWVADVTETGLVIPESIAGDGDLDFPLDLFWQVCGEQPERLRVNVHDLFQAWRDEDVLGDVWMNSVAQGDATSIDYHNAASDRDTPTIGLGFNRVWEGTSIEGVVFESGYIACYDVTTASAFVQFVDDELLPYCDYANGEDDAQQTLGDNEPTCEDCGRESDSIEDGRCIVCRDGGGR